MSIQRGVRVAWVLVLGSIGSWTASGCASEVTRSGNSNTNWLKSCETDSNCGAGLGCICGTCTVLCNKQSCDAVGREAVCVSPSPSEFTAACGQRAPGAICSVACSANSDCRAFGMDLRCIGGVCAVGSLLAEAGTHTLPDGSPGTAEDAGSVRPPKVDAAPANSDATVGKADSQPTDCLRDVSVGGGQTCGRMASGFAWCWGSDEFGELGDGMVSDHSPVPVLVAPEGSASFQVFAGYHRTCIRLNNNTLWCSGANEHGQIGDGTVGGDKACGGSAGLNCRSTPVKVELGDPFPTSMSQSPPLAMGYEHTCAVTQNPSFNLLCWGSHENGQLGTGRPGSTICSGVPCENAPVPVTLLGSTVESVTAGERHTCARLNDDSVTCWGDDRFGQLGYVIPSCNPDGGVTPCFWASPQTVAALGSTVLQVVSGRSHNCVKRHDSTVWCWGKNDLGQLGDGTTSGVDCPGLGPCKATPVRVEGLPTGGISRIAAGGDTTCAVAAVDGAVWCWGSNSNGKLGNGNTSVTYSAVPIKVSIPRSQFDYVTTLSVGAGNHSCVHLPENTAWCWGSNQYGQLGDGTQQDQPRPVEANVCR